MAMMAAVPLVLNDLLGNKVFMTGLLAFLAAQVGKVGLSMGCRRGAREFPSMQLPPTPSYVDFELQGAKDQRAA